MIDRWNPFREMMSLREAMDRLLEDSVVRPTGLAQGTRAGGESFGFPMDVSERDDNYVVRASLPGVKPDDVQITVQGDTLHIRGETKQENERRDGERWITREHRSGRFERVVTLPTAVDTEKAEARFDNGVLELTLPKAEALRPRQIKIGSGAAGSLPGGRARAGTATSGSTTQTGTPSGQGGQGPSETRVEPQNKGETVRPAGAPSDKDAVTEGSKESFPASDAPSWTPERA
jgi:HSP20 family protein